MIAPANQWGPFADNLDDAERRARLRSLRALAAVYAGPRALTLCQQLARAEADPVALESALDALDRLASLDRRRILSSFASLHRPAR